MTPALKLHAIGGLFAHLQLANRPRRPAVASPYLTTREAAAYLRVSYGTFRNWATKIKRAKTRRYRREDLDHFAATRRK